MPKEEIERLYRAYFSTVYGVCFLYMRNEADSCDMVQETFLKLMKSPFTYQDDEKTKAWLIVTASNCCKSQLSKWWRKKCTNYEAELNEKIEHNPDNMLLHIVLDLEQKYRLPIYLYYFEGYKSDEIASILHTNASTIRSRLAKARELLRMELLG